MHRKRPSSTERRLRIPFVRRIHNVKEHRPGYSPVTGLKLVEKNATAENHLQSSRLREAGFYTVTYGASSGNFVNKTLIYIKGLATFRETANLVFLPCKPHHPPGG